MARTESTSDASNSSSSISLHDKIRGAASRAKKRFGRIAVEVGFLTRKQLKKALVIQKKLEKKTGTAPPLGRVLTKKGYMTEEQCEMVFKAQGRRGGHTEIEGYKLKEKIGSGSMGAVYRARQLNMDRDVAIKILAPKLAMQSKYQKRFVREAQTVASLNHPHIVHGFDVCESNGIYFFVMEYIDGPTVRDLIEQEGKLDAKKAIRYTAHITKALNHAREENLVHMDVEPENILVNSEDYAKLCDLGMAQVVVGPDEEERIPGSPYYLAPEQIANGENVSIRTDLYSLGATFYHMLTGRVPFRGESPKEILEKHLNESPTPPSELNETLPGDLDEIVLRMLSKNLNKRYQTPAELLEDLNEVSESISNGSRHSGDGPNRRFVRRRFRR